MEDRASWPRLHISIMRLPKHGLISFVCSRKIIGLSIGKRLVVVKSTWRLTCPSFGQSPPFSRRPILHQKDGKLILSFSRRPLLGSPTSPRTSGIPNLNDVQVEALNLVEKTAEDSALVFDLEPGACLFWNNLGLLHSRSISPYSYCYP